MSYDSNVPVGYEELAEGVRDQRGCEILDYDDCPQMILDNYEESELLRKEEENV